MRRKKHPSPYMFFLLGVLIVVVVLVWLMRFL
jgi:hypothetical protein